MKFPHDLLRFFYWIFFKPLSLHKWIQQLDPTLGTVAALLTHSYAGPAQSLKRLVSFYVFAVPVILGIGTGLIFAQLGMDVNWLKLAFYLLVGIGLSLTFNIPFCIAFLLPFSVLVAIWSSTSFTPALGILFSLTLGLAYGLNADSARWGLLTSSIYCLFLGLLLGPLSGLFIGAAFLVGYFRIIFFVVEAPLSWILGTLAVKGDALRLWQCQPLRWDELIWLPLPRLDEHLLALIKQNEPAAQKAILHVQGSFRQGWAIKQ